ncbi:ubiquitin carboxyl-terminal hydrolase 36-like isoform X3 [Ischnura elegans]|uniref:ubiquitin carboxyl-terminal hydrolase 36-like isoform X3 n=1 Tax=Ischnura elegans TaxID=197161 RepID=UPI001ED8A85A|nr:ubiquitin carboxyl-terminal hydrolase 36-like isoform X3 [Ischnura elegans]
MSPVSGRCLSLGVYPPTVPFKMSSGRNRDYRKLYSRGNVSRNAWQPYPQRRPQYTLPRSRRSEEEDDLYYETRLIDSAHKVLNSRVEFVRSSQSCMHRRDTYEGHAKVITLRTFGLSESSHEVRTPSRSPISSPIKSLPSPGVKLNGSKVEIRAEQKTEEDPDGPPVPKVSLFPESRIILGWKKAFPVGAGMSNLGNTCYLNATLQALFHIPSFCNWLMSELDHDENNGCKELDENGEKCIICAMATTLKIVRNKSGGIMKPYLIYNRLKSICKHMSYGRQEDAHEFLRYLLEKMELSYLERFKGRQLENASKETTPVHRIFGGYLRSEISCLFCKGTSTTFQHFQDLMLDIRRSSSLDDALQLFFSRENLEGDDGGVGEGGDAYKCGKCHIKGRCVKRSSIQIAPKVLCIQLKRFTAVGGKLVKHLSYPEKLDMSPYLDYRHTGQLNSSYPAQRPLMYHLTSIVSHSGASMNSGHYTATAKTPNGAFYEFDDTYVHQVSLHGSLEANAYILMYEMIPSREETSTNCSPLKSPSSVYNSNGGLSKPPEKIRPFVMPSYRLLGPSPRPLNGASSSMPAFTATSSSNSFSTSLNSTALPPAKEREKVFFDIKSPSQASSGSLLSRPSASCVSKSHLEYNQSSPRKLSPEPKSQNTMSRTSPKVNGVDGSPSKTNGSQLAGSSTASLSSPAKSVRQPSKSSFSSTDGNQAHGVGSADGSNGREGAEKSLDRLSKLGVLVGVSGKGRDAECLGNGKSESHHLVSYPILSGESSDEEEDRRGVKRSRKISENGVSKHPSPSSEMTISGNLTADATAIAASRGWNINGSSAGKGTHDIQKTNDNGSTKVMPEVSTVRKDLLNGNQAEFLVGEGARTEKNDFDDVCSKSEVKKLDSLEEKEKCETSAAASTENERLGERRNGTSQPSSPCSSSSSSSLESCSPVLNGTTEFKSILKIIDRSNCGMMEDTGRKESEESPCKLKSMPNGIGNVAGEGAASAGRKVVSKVAKWLNECDFDACKSESSFGSLDSISVLEENGHLPTTRRKCEPKCSSLPNIILLSPASKTYGIERKLRVDYRRKGVKGSKSIGEGILLGSGNAEKSSSEGRRMVMPEGISVCNIKSLIEEKVDSFDVEDEYDQGVIEYHMPLVETLRIPRKCAQSGVGIREIKKGKKYMEDSGRRSACRSSSPSSIWDPSSISYHDWNLEQRWKELTRDPEQELPVSGKAKNSNVVGKRTVNGSSSLSPRDQIFEQSWRSLTLAPKQKLAESGKVNNPSIVGKRTVNSRGRAKKGGISTREILLGSGKANKSSVLGRRTLQSEGKSVMSKTLIEDKMGSFDLEDDNVTAVITKRMTLVERQRIPRYRAITGMGVGVREIKKSKKYVEDCGRSSASQSSSPSINWDQSYMSLHDWNLEQQWKELTSGLKQT